MEIGYRRTGQILYQVFLIFCLLNRNIRPQQSQNIEALHVRIEVRNEIFVVNERILHR